MGRATKLYNVLSICSATTVGWWIGKNTGTVTKKEDINVAEKGIFSLAKLPSVYAAGNKGTVSLYQPAPVTNIVAEPAKNAPRIAQIMRFGFPNLSNIRSLEDYILSYDTRNRVPYWVFEHLTEENLAKNDAVTRESCDFHVDQSVHEYFRAHNSDYKGSGFDRGHMAAAGNHKQSQKQCQETFLLSNMAPQVGRGFNRDKWNELESYCRKLAKQSKNVYVCTGPLYLPRREEDGKLYVKYQVVGQNHVSVPTHFFKIVLSEKKTGEFELESYLLPNQAISDSASLQTFYTPTEIIERASGLLFFDKINKGFLSKINGQRVS